MLFRLLLLLIATGIAVKAVSLGIPGTTQTLSGYDTELGEDPICWSSVASTTPNEGISFPTGGLVEAFQLAGKVELLPVCPTGTTLQALPPEQFTDPEFRPRTKEWYNFTVKGSLDMTELNGIYVNSDEGSRIALSIVACDTVKAGFCSPFVHEQANLREAKEATENRRLSVKPKRKVGDRHGGTHVHAPAVVLDLPEVPSVVFDFEATVPLMINDPGGFFMIGTLQFFTGDNIGETTFRYDVANALPGNQRLTVFQDPSTILKVTDTVKIISFVVVGLASAVIMGLIWQMVRHYHSQVMKISQAPFLLLLLLAALLATVASVLFAPESDFYCNIAQPLVILPLHLFYALILGRLWRIHAVVSPVLRNHLQRATSVKTTSNRSFRGGFFEKRRIMDFFQRPRNNQFRREVQSRSVVWIVILATTPQLGLQLARVFLQPKSKEIDYNADQSIGRCMCGAGLDLPQSLDFYSLLLLLLLVLTLLCMAHVSRNLPSLLNESHVIYETTLVSVMLGVLGLGILAVTDTPTTSPNVAYLVSVMVVLSITVNTTLRIMVPKLRFAWSGEKILVSRLVADHRQTLNRASTGGTTNILDPRSSSTAGLSHKRQHPEQRNQGCDSGISSNPGEDESSRPPSFACTSSSTAGIATAPKGAGTIEADETSNSSKQQQYDSSTAQCQSTYIDEPVEEDDELEAPATPQSTSSRSSQQLWLQQVEMSSNDSKAASQPAATSLHNVPKQRSHRESASTKGQQKQSHNIVIRQGYAPSKTVVLKMIDLQGELVKLTNRVMSGLSVDPDEWNQVRDLTEQMEAIFQRVQFEWERTRGDENA